MMEQDFMQTQEMLAALLNTSEQQSRTTEKLLVELKGQIAALAVATKVTQNAASSVGQCAASVEQAASNAAPALQKAAEQAVGAAVDIALKRALESASSVAAAVIDDAARPTLEQLSSVAAKAQQAEQQLNKAAASFGWKWAAIAGGALALTLATFMLVAWMSIWLQRFQVTELAEQKTQLQGEIAQLQTQVAVLAKKGARIKLAKCGARLCIEASSDQGKGEGNGEGQGGPGWSGPWKNGENGAALVIPNGY
jgi:hypothetical protein